MTYAQRFALALAVTLALSLTTARAQTPSVSTVNVTPDERKVRVVAVGDVLDVRVAVSDESGDVVFESGPVAGDKLDWTMSDSQGLRVPAGSYTLTVTYRTAAGKLKRRVEQVLVTEEVGGEARQEAAAPVPSAPVEGAGSAGKIAKFTGASTLGNSVMTESVGRVGVNTAAPTHTLTVAGGPSWTTSGWSGSVALPNLGSIGWAANSAGQRRGIGHGANGLYFFRTSSNPGSAISVAVPDLVINNVGNVGVGTTSPAAKLSVNGTVQILGAGSGIKFADGSIQTKAIAGTISGTGTANRLAKFTGPNSFGNSTITEVSGRVGIGTTAPQQPLEIASGRMRFSSDLGDIEFTETADLIAHATTASPTPSLPAFRVDVGTGLTRAFTVLNNGRVGIGTITPSTLLEIKGTTPEGSFGIDTLLRVTGSAGGNASNIPIIDVRNEGGGRAINARSNGIAVRGDSDSIAISGASQSGTGLSGFSNTGHAINTFSPNGYAGVFNGKVQVNGTFENNSDRHAKTNITAIDPRSILHKLASIPIQAWNYKTEGASIRHLGPMAQDFRAAFGLGTGETTISTVDANGVALASIQALYQQNQALLRTVEELKARLAQVERSVKRKRAARRRRVGRDFVGGK